MPEVDHGSAVAKHFMTRTLAVRMGVLVLAGPHCIEIGRFPVPHFSSMSFPCPDRVLFSSCACYMCVFDYASDSALTAINWSKFVAVKVAVCRTQHPLKILWLNTVQRFLSISGSTTMCVRVRGHPLLHLWRFSVFESCASRVARHYNFFWL